LIKTPVIFNCVITPKSGLFDFSKNIESISLLPPWMKN